MITVLLIVSVVVFTFFSGYSEISVMLSPPASCRVVRKDIAVLSVFLLLCLGMSVAPSRQSANIEEISWPIIISAILAFAAGRYISRFSSFVLAIMGAIVGAKLFTGGTESLSPALPLSWLSASVCCAIVAMIGSYLIRLFLSGLKIHYFKQMWNIALLATIFAALMIFAVGMNIGIFYNSYILPLPWTLAILAMLVGGAAAIPLIKQYMHKLSETTFDINPEDSLAVIVSVLVVTLLFTLESTAQYLSAGPKVLPPSLLILSALFGTGISRNRAVLENGSVVRYLLSVLFVPVVAMIISFFLTAAIRPESIDTSSAAFRSLTLLMAAIVLVMLSVLAISNFLSFRRTKNALEEMENFMNEHRHTVNSLEIKTMQAENQYLRTHLSLKHQEALNIAININEQKEFISRIHDMVREAEHETDQQKKNEALHKIGTELSLRMNFTSEIDSFYAHVEQLHKDFTVRLNEKFPTLTKQERRLTTLLRLEFSSKYIATLMNISPKSVEICRHRLRTKFGLTRQQSLVGFIKNI